MNTTLAISRGYFSIFLLVGAVTMFGCSKKTDADQNKDTAPVTTTEASKSTTDNPEKVTDASAAPPELALVVQNYGMAKFSALKRLNDLGFTLFSIFPDGNVSQGMSSSIANYEIDWGSAKANNYGATDIALLTPSIKNLNTGQAIAPQQITISRTLEKKIALNASESFSAIVKIETLISDGSRTICALGFSSP